MLKISKVKRNSIAKELGLEVGDEIIAFDGFACEDELDYLYYCETDGFSMTVKDHRSGEQATLEIEKDEGEDLGLSFESFLSRSRDKSSLFSSFFIWIHFSHLDL